MTDSTTSSQLFHFGEGNLCEASHTKLSRTTVPQWSVTMKCDSNGFTNQLAVLDDSSEDGRTPLITEWHASSPAVLPLVDSDVTIKLVRRKHICTRAGSGV